MYGLDINPRAVKISWINLYLNALDDNGQPFYDHESDLLAYCRDNHIELERIVGCIPQVIIITYMIFLWDKVISFSLKIVKGSRTSQSG